MSNIEMNRENDKIIDDFFKRGSCHLTYEFGLYKMSRDFFTDEEIAENDAMHRFDRESIIKNIMFWRGFFQERHAAGQMNDDCFNRTIKDLNDRSNNFARKLVNFKSSYKGN